MNWNTPTILLLFSLVISNTEFNIQIITACISKCHSAQIKDPLVGVYFSWGLTYGSPICLQACSRITEVYRASGMCAPVLWEYRIYGAENGAGKRNRGTKKSRFEMTDSPSENCLKYWALSSCLCFLMWRGQSERQPSLGLLSVTLPSWPYNRNLHHMGIKVIIFWILKWHKEKC